MRRGVTYGVLAGALWGVVFLAPMLLPEFSPWAMSAGRYLAYGVVSALAALPLGRALFARLTKRDVAMLFALSLVGNLAYYIFLAAAVQRVGVAPSSLIIGVLPVTITLVGAREHGAVSIRRLLLPLAVILIGIACINVDVFTVHTPAAPGVNGGWVERALGLVCATLALASWTWFAVVNARYLQRHHRFSGNEWSVLSGLASGVLGALLGAVLLLMPSAAIKSGSLGTAHWHLFLILNFVLAIGASWLGNSLWNAASRRLPLTLSGQMIVFETLFALLYGFIFAARLPRPLEVAAIVLLVGGVLWSVGVHVQRPATDAPPH